MTTPTPNGQRLLRTLIKSGPTYRADLARALHVSRATATNLTNRLRAGGWIEEVDPEPGSLKNLIGTTPALGVLASVMFLVDNCTVTLATLDGRLLTEFTLHTAPDGSPAERVAAGAEVLDRLLSELTLGADSLRAVHLAVDTQMDAHSGDVFSPRASSRWYGVNPKQYFATRFDVPVHAQNTARLEGLAEYLAGGGHGATDVLYVDVSYGITSGHVIDGIIQSGSRGGSGELGHVIYDWSGPLCACGNPGCLMQYASVPAMLRDFNTGADSSVDWETFAARVRAGDVAAVTIAHRAAEVLGRVLVNTCHLVDPAVVVLSGEVTRAIPFFVDRVADVLRERALPLVSRNVRVVAARLDDTHAATARAGIDSLRAIDDVAADLPTG